jgi:hypothetical protein
MRGILVQSLVRRGVPFAVALATATAIRDRIAPRGKVRLDDISSLVDELLDDRYDLDVLGAVTAIEPPRVVEEDGSWSPVLEGHPRGLPDGAGPSPATPTTWRAIEQSLLRQAAPPSTAPSCAIWSPPRSSARTPGPARWYRAAQRATTAAQPGAVGRRNGSGTSLAIEVACRLELPRVIGTDSIRQIMRLMFSPDLCPRSTARPSTRTCAAPRDLLVGDPVVVGSRAGAEDRGWRTLLERAVERTPACWIEAPIWCRMLELGCRYQGRAHVTSSRRERSTR